MKLDTNKLTKKDIKNALNQEVPYMPVMNETIVKAAIKYQEKIYTGYRHALIMEDIWKEIPKAEIELGQQGFMTNTGRFVNRNEAANIAFKANQIPNGINSLDSYQIFKL